MLRVIFACIFVVGCSATFTYTGNNAQLTEAITFDATCFMDTSTIPLGCEDVYTNARDGYTDVEECYTVWPTFDYAMSLCGGNNFHTVQTFCESQRAWPGEMYTLKDNELYADDILYSGCYLPTNLEWVTSVQDGKYTSMALGSRAFTCQSLLHVNATAFPTDSTNITEPYGLYTRAAFQVNETTTDCVVAQMAILQSNVNDAHNVQTRQDNFIKPLAFLYTTLVLGVIALILSVVSACMAFK
jgi:hypothetical protein